MPIELSLRACWMAALLVAAMTAPLSAQHADRHHGAHGGESPYAGLEAREIKALSDDQLADLRDGRGMGLALAAELNGYPGPLHTLELAEPLELTPEQLAATQAMFEDMQSRAAELGGRIIERERALDELFAERQPTARAVEAATLEIARLEGELRAHHLSYHLRMMELLDADQIRRYSHLRGYQGASRH